MTPLWKSHKLWSTLLDNRNLLDIRRVRGGVATLWPQRHTLRASQTAFSLVGEKRKGVGIQLPQQDGMLPGRPTWASLQKDHWRNLLSLSTVNQIDMEKESGTDQEPTVSSWQTMVALAGAPEQRSHVQSWVSSPSGQAAQLTVLPVLAPQPMGRSSSEAHPVTHCGKESG